MPKIIPSKIDEACDRALSTIGFHSPRRGNPIIRIDDDIYGWVGLNRHRVEEGVQINPFIGIHSVSIMRLWHELEPHINKKYVLGKTATVAIHMGELAPTVRTFVFNSPGQYEEEASRLAYSIAEFGVPWMRSHANLQSLLPLLRERESMLGGFPQRVAIVLFLQNRFDELLEYLDARLAEYLAQPGWAAMHESWAHFSNALRERLG